MADDADKQERRTFFRLDDDVIFDYIVINEDDTHEDFGKDEPIVNCMKILDDIRDIDTLGQPALQRIAMHNPSIADYLRSTNKKIDIIVRFLTEELLAKFVLHADDRRTQSVNLSAGGIGFYANEALAENSLIKVKIILLPGYDCIITNAVVVNCHPEAGEQYRIAAKYVQLEEQEEQRIIRHIYAKQIEQHQRHKQQAKGKPE